MTSDDSTDDDDVSSNVEKLGTELEEEGLLFALREKISTLILGADPDGEGDLVEELLASIHEELLIMASASGGSRVTDPWNGGSAIGVDWSR